MDHPAKLVTLAFLASLGTFAHAGYAQLADPVGFSGGPNDWKFAPSANDQSYGKVVHQPNGLKAPVPGKVVTMPASYRFASNAGRVASGFVFLNPYVRTAVNIAAWLLSAKLIWDEVNKVWRQTSDQGAGGSAGLWYFPSHPDLGEATSTQVLCQRASAKHFVNVPGYTPFSFFPTGEGMGECSTSAGTSGGYSLRKKEGADVCPPGWTQTPAGCLSPALEQPQFEDILSPEPMPSRVPWELPYPSPLPVERPWINPSPGPDPEHRPRFVPTGDPVKNPDYNPSADPSPDNQPWRQPGVRIVPRPTDAEPWRVDYQPTNRPVPGPEPQPDVDEGPGQGNPSDKPIENADLCEKHPDIVACAKMDEVKPEDVNNEDKPLTITPETGWGNENAACPAPVTKQVAGLNLEMSWQPFCDFAKGIRPVVIAMAWLSAALLVLGIARKGD